MEFVNPVIRLVQNPTVTASVCFAGLYAAYYLFYVVKKPVIACGDKKFRQFIDKHCPVSREKFWPTWWCFEARAHTILRALLQSCPEVDYSEEYLTTPDGGEIKLDWSENDSNTKYTKDLRPTIVMLPGLTGSSKENYILHMVHDANDLGYRSVVFNNRGTGDTKLKTPRTYCAANIEDTEFVIQHVKNKYPNAPLMGVGVSLGGMIIFNYMALKGKSADLIAAMSISVGWDVFAACDSLDKAINYYLFNKTLAKSLCYLVEKNLHLFEHHLDIDTAHVLRSESIKDFDERFTSKLFGYDSVDHYYTEASLHTKVHALAKPVLCLSAADDPFSPEHSIPMAEAEQNDNIAIVKTSHGGHIGFLEGTFPRDRSYMYRWFKQYVSAVFEQGFKDE
ncbi:phospholipase ABHD3-like isoform X2 [Physella acuta]|uniref:phospholipase ABHD3-like isoform X2 n=1 Tax=Physella acuta TaxID=109671 RepID=UPI0027DAC265|nr:phospholipase ABHD3-like isoform X2 [Physella acuta]